MAWAFGVSVLLGKGDGSFHAAYNLPVAFGANSIAVGDFNGDGKPDIVTTNFMTTGAPPRIPGFIVDSYVWVYLGNGDGTFQAGTRYGAGIGPSSVVVGDFNRDGTPDLAVTNCGSLIYWPGSMTVSVLMGKGDGTFAAAQTYFAGNEPTSVSVGDFNGDGYPDLAITNGSGPDPGSVTILLNAADWGP